MNGGMSRAQPVVSSTEEEQKLLFISTLATEPTCVALARADREINPAFRRDLFLMDAFLKMDGHKREK